MNPRGFPEVHILDPCTGTGNFIVNLLRRIPKRDLPRMYREQLFANEVMLLPYYIAALNSEHACYELTGEYEPFEGLCFVDTLDMAEHAQSQFGFMTELNTARVQRQKNAPITVIIGNPPYNVGQLNENDNNKNRKYEVVDKRIRETFAADSNATNKNALSDMYVKFFRWAIDRLGERDGLVCLVSNNSFVDQIAFDGMRKHLARDFTAIYHVDLHGNVRKNPRLSGTTHNVFGIQVGVGITVAVRNAAHPDHAIYYHRVPEDWRKEEKLNWLAAHNSIHGLRNAGILPAPPAGEDACVTTRNRGYLPHWHSNDAETIYYVTFRLADSLPATLLAEIEAERERLLKRAQDQNTPMSKTDRAQMEHMFSERIEQFLDSGAGACHLANPSVAAMMRDVLFHFDGERYDIHAWVIMPNHVHLLLNCRPGWDLSKVLHSLKSFSSKQANTLLHTSGKFWQTESYDHIVRNEKEYNRIIKYIVENPERAQMNDWPWVGSAGILPAAPAGEDACATWSRLIPDAGNTWLIPEHADRFAAFIPIGTKSAKADDATDVPTIFKLYGRGVETCRDDVLYGFDGTSLLRRVERFVEDYNSEVDRWRRAPGGATVDEFVRCESIKWCSTLKQHLQRGTYAEAVSDRVRVALYRPFLKSNLYYDRVLIHRPGLFASVFPTCGAERENRVIVMSDLGYRADRFSALLSNCIPDLHLCAAIDAHQCFPFYIYDEDGINRRENITDWALAQFKAIYQEPDTKRERKRQPSVVTQASSPAGLAGKMPALQYPREIDKWDLFYYVYGLLHHPGYRTKYADNLKRELPRIPFAPDFWAFSEAGRELAHWHLDYEQVDPYPLKFEVAKDRPLSYRVEDKMRLSKDKTSLTVNPSLTLSGIPAEAFEYRLGNRSALEWVIDQYQVKHDAKSQVTSAPNRSDDPEYIVRLVGQVIRVSLETVRIVKSLPADFGG